MIATRYPLVNVANDFISGLPLRITITADAIFRFLLHTRDEKSHTTQVLTLSYFCSVCTGKGI